MQFRDLCKLFQDSSAAVKKASPAWGLKQIFQLPLPLLISTDPFSLVCVCIYGLGLTGSVVYLHIVTASARS